MQRRRSVSHTFEDRIAAERTKLKAQAAQQTWSRAGRAPQENQAARYSFPYERVAFLAWTATTKARIESKAASVGRRPIGALAPVASVVPRYTIWMDL
jgi:hypothetical protein